MFKFDNHSQFVVGDVQIFSESCAHTVVMSPEPEEECSLDSFD